MRVKVVSAHGLAAADANGKSDPYAIIRWDAQPKHFTKTEGKIEAKKQKAQKHGKVVQQQTVVQKKTTNPVWNQTFDMVLPGPIQPSDILTLVLYDYDVVGDHDFLGSAHVEMAGLVQGVERQGTYPVFSKKGTVTVSLTALNFSVPMAPGLEGNINANKQIAAESARKRASYKKWKKGHDAGHSAGKAVGKMGKMLGKLF